MHTEILSTLLVFLTSNNREIVKSTLGYIKLSIHTMPLALLQPHLPSLVPALLKWSHDHKNHFKAKVRHIFERMIRRFGFDEVYKCASSQEDGDGVEEARKVLVNIKKRKERAKRKKGRAAANEDGEDEDDGEATKPATGDAFEDVLYGSESELEDSDDDEPESKGAKKKGNGGARLRVDDDEPMDLLSGAASKITSRFHGFQTALSSELTNANFIIIYRRKEQTPQARCGRLEIRNGRRRQNDHRRRRLTRQ